MMVLKNVRGAKVRGAGVGIAYPLPVPITTEENGSSLD